MNVLFTSRCNNQDMSPQRNASDSAVKLNPKPTKRFICLQYNADDSRKSDTVPCLHVKIELTAGPRRLGRLGCSRVHSQSGWPVSAAANEFSCCHVWALTPCLACRVHDIDRFGGMICRTIITSRQSVALAASAYSNWHFNTLALIFLLTYLLSYLLTYFWGGEVLPVSSLTDVQSHSKCRNHLPTIPAGALKIHDVKK